MPFGWFPMDREFFAVVVTWHIRCCWLGHVFCSAFPLEDSLTFLRKMIVFLLHNDVLAV